MIQGRIIRSISGFYDIVPGEGQSSQLQDRSFTVNADGTVRVRAKGNFRKKGITPLVGDEVICGGGLLTQILPRRNQLVRPYVANVDQAVLVCACVYPEPSLLLLERFIAMVSSQGVRPILVFNKWDQLKEAPQSEIPDVLESYRRAGFTVIAACTLTGQGIDELKKELEGKTSVFAGPSGVGKSSLLNLLLPQEEREVGELSEKIQRGKNTTRISELLENPQIHAWIADTPGFTSLYYEVDSEETLKKLYPEFAPWANQCYYMDCSHTDETDCAVKPAVEKGHIEKLRYQGYCLLYSEWKKNQEQLYDKDHTKGGASEKNGGQKKEK